MTNDEILRRARRMAEEMRQGLESDIKKLESEVADLQTKVEELERWRESQAV